MDRFHSVNNNKFKEISKKNRMGCLVFKITAIQPDGKMSTIQRKACIQAPTDIWNFVTRYKKLSFGSHQGRDGGHIWALW